MPQGRTDVRMRIRLCHSGGRTPERPSVMTVLDLIPDVTVILIIFLVALRAYAFQRRSWKHHHQAQAAKQRCQLHMQLMA
jgi:hypothetical protein